MNGKTYKLVALAPPEEQIQAPVQDTPSSQQPETWTQFFGRNIGRGAQKAISSPFELLGALGQLGESLGTGVENLAQRVTGLKPADIQQEGMGFFLSSPEKLAKSVGIGGSEQIKKGAQSLGIDTEPHSRGEKVFDYMAESLPLLGLGYGAVKEPFMKYFLHGLAREGVAGATKEGLEKAGVGALGQFFGSLGSSLGYEYLRGIRPGNIMNYMKDKQSDLYDRSKSLANNVKIPGTKLRFTLNQDINKVMGSAPGIESSKKSLVQRELKNVRDLVKRGMVDAPELIEQKQHLNALIRSERDPNVKRYFKKAVGDINKAIQGSGNKKFIDTYNRADSITQLLHQTDTAEDTIKGVMGTLKNVLKDTPLKTIFSGSGWLLRDIAPEPKWLKSPEGWKYMAHILNASLTGNKAAIARNLKNLDKVAREYKDKPKTYKLVRRS